MPRFIWILCALGLGTGIHAAELAALTHSVVAVTERDGGVRETNRGLGFVHDDHFYTTRHTVPEDGTTVVFVDGVALVPIGFNDAEDLAVFGVPESLCERICGSNDVGSWSDARRVTWLQPDTDRLRPMLADIVEVVYFDGLRSLEGGGCEANVVIAIDREVVPGTSGAPVVDYDTGRLLGMAQGTFENAEGAAFGFFKPMRCVMRGLGMQTKGAASRESA